MGKKLTIEIPDIPKEAVVLGFMGLGIALLTTKTAGEILGRKTADDAALMLAGVASGMAKSLPETERQDIKATIGPKGALKS